MSLKQRAKRHLGTYYYVATLESSVTCGHKHATVRAAVACRDSQPGAGFWRRPRIFMAHLGMLPGKPLD